MEGVKFENVRQVEDLYEKLIDNYNEVLIEYEELEAIDDDIQELRNTTLDKFDYEIMSEVYRALNEKETAEQLEEKTKECQELIEELQEKLSGINISEHLSKFYEMEVRKENFDIQMKACEKYLEKSQRKREADKMRTNLRPASPRRFPNLTRVPSPRFIPDSSDEESEEECSSEEEKPPTPKESPPPSPVKGKGKGKGGKKPAPKINLIETEKPAPALPAPALPAPELLPLPEVPSSQTESKSKGKPGRKKGQ
jgi:DNA-binding transcriptional ArsR family regulator